jgi:hypothetical protein
LRIGIAVFATAVLASAGVTVAAIAVPTGSASGAVPTNPPPGLTLAPTFTSSNTDFVTACSSFTYLVTTTGVPEPAISLTAGSALPNGVTLTDNGNGTADLDGTSTLAAGSYSFGITADNGVSPNATQSFTLNVGASLNCVDVELQTELQSQYSQFEQLLSNLLKAFEATLGAIVGNLKS